MALDTQLSDASANAGCGPIVARANGGSLKIYDGTKPANGNTAVATQNVLATFTLQNPAFGSVTAGLASLAGTPLTATATRTGTATWFRIFASDSSVVLDGTVGTSTCNLNLNNVAIQQNATVQIDGYNYSIAEAGQ